MYISPAPSSELHRALQPTPHTMYRIVVFAVLVAAAAAAPGYIDGLGGLGGLGLGHGLAIAAPAVSVAHAPIATSYANSNLISRTVAVHAIAAPAPVIVKSIASPVAVGPLGLGYGLGLGIGAHY